jgi:N-glycosylase/DNA lyase
MVSLISEINQLRQNKEISKKILLTLDSFNQYKETASNEGLFSELCYCILTANCHAQSCITLQNTFPYDFSKATEKQIKNHLIKHHYRFPNIRTKYIIDAQNHINDLQNILNKYHGLKLRIWFVNNISGLGMKEASHFLRNIGYKDYAIIDTHILTLLQKHRIIKKPKTITKNIYLHIEKQLDVLAQETGLNLAALDLYLWFIQTGMILK